MWRNGWTPSQSWGKNNPFRYWTFRDCPSPLPTMAQEAVESAIWRRQFVSVFSVCLMLIGAGVYFIHTYAVAAIPIAFALAMPISQRIKRQGREIFGQAVSCAVDPSWIYHTGEDVFTLRARKLTSYPFVKGSQDELRAELVRLQPRARAWLEAHSGLMKRFSDSL